MPALAEYSHEATESSDTVFRLKISGPRDWDATVVDASVVLSDFAPCYAFH